MWRNCARAIYLFIFLLGFLFAARRAGSGRMISNGNRTEIRSVIIQVITKSDDRAAGVRFVYYEYDYKQLLDEVFVISRIIKVEVRVISRSRRLRLITLTETLIILDITKTESNNCFIIH